MNNPTTTRSVRILTTGTSILALGVALAWTAPADATMMTITASNAGTVIENDGDGLGDATTGSLFAGDDEFDGDMTNKLERTVTIFQLPALDPGQSVGSARFRISPYKVSNNPGDLSLYHLSGSNGASETAGQYEASASLVSGSPGFITASSPTTNPGTYQDVDVTSEVQLDYDSDPSGNQVSTFRLQADTGQGSVFPASPNGNSTSDEYTFYSQNNDNTPPVLELNIVPEPGSLALIGVGGLLMLSRRRRKDIREVR